ncbi:MAG TPA: hypothetical protein VJX23_01015 [Candidatus Binataceae bacterium]|nr:hypothetical protein [Candidatus Binataceae bacterium]
MAKRKRKRRRGPGTWVIIAIALVIAGFIIRRTLVPQLLHYLAYRPAENPPPAAEPTSPPEQSQPAAAQPVPRDSASAPSEDLSASDRQQLQEILKRKAK